MRRAVLAAAVASAASAGFIAPAPSYDPWMWLVWGREVSTGTLSTLDGPAFKPLPVAVCALLGVFGSAGPHLWVLLARAGGLLALILAFGLARRLAGGSIAAGALAAVGVAVTGQFAAYVSSGVSEGLLLALALAGFELWRVGRRRPALGCAIACALLRVETWPFLLVGAAVLWRREPRLRAMLLAAVVLIPLAWFVPEFLGSGDWLRSGARARIPNPGQPALAAVPALASLRAAMSLIAWPLWLGLAALILVALAAHRRRSTHALADVDSARPRVSPAVVGLTPAVVGAAWIAVVAAMAQVGFSGEPRYAMPGAALIAIAGAVGLSRCVGLVANGWWGRPDQASGEGQHKQRRLPGRQIVMAASTCAAIFAIAGPRAAELARLPAAQDHQQRLSADLASSIVALGGRERVVECGAPFVGPLRGPLLAYHLGVAKRVVKPDAPPTPPGVVFSSALTRDHATAPEPGRTFAPAGRLGSWRLATACRDRTSLRLRVP